MALVVDHPHLNMEQVAQIHQAGIKAMTYTVNEPERAQELKAAGLNSPDHGQGGFIWASGYSLR